MNQRLRRGAGGQAALYDATLAPDFSLDWLDAAVWRASDAAQSLAGGRGGVLQVETSAGNCVLRHYRRGGLVAKLCKDRYLWRGAAHTRSFREFRLLVDMAALGLPVPAVVGAGYRRAGLYYRADLLTMQLPAAQSLAQLLAAIPASHWAEPLQAVGSLIARFHRTGFCHADLNAHNILATADGWYLIDFDRGQRRLPATAWQTANLARLRRSLRKLFPDMDGKAIETDGWQVLVQSYQRELER